MNWLKLVIFDLDDTLFDSSGQLQSGEDLDGIRPFPGVTDLLAEIHARGIPTALVSTGDSPMQRTKIKLLGLRNLLDLVYICQRPEDKMALFQKCFRKFKVKPPQTLVVGDRIDREIQIGKALGCVTVRILHGKHSHMVAQSEREMADFTIFNVVTLRLWFTPPPVATAQEHG